MSRAHRWGLWATVIVLLLAEALWVLDAAWWLRQYASTDGVVAQLAYPDVPEQTLRNARRIHERLYPTYRVPFEVLQLGLSAVMAQACWVSLQADERAQQRLVTVLPFAAGLVVVRGAIEVDSYFGAYRLLAAPIEAMTTVSDRGYANPFTEQARAVARDAAHWAAIIVVGKAVMRLAVYGIVRVVLVKRRAESPT